MQWTLVRPLQPSKSLPDYSTTRIQHWELRTRKTNCVQFYSPVACCPILKQNLGHVILRKQMARAALFQAASQPHQHSFERFYYRSYMHEPRWSTSIPNSSSSLSITTTRKFQMSPWMEEGRRILRYSRIRLHPSRETSYTSSHLTSLFAGFQKVHAESFPHWDGLTQGLLQHHRLIALRWKQQGRK